MSKNVPVANNLTTEDGYRLPGSTTLQKAIQFAVIEDKPVMMDYWTSSLEKTSLIGVKSTDLKEKLLVKNEDEYTSPIQKIYKVENDFIIFTENSIYIVDVNIPKKSIS
jgi:hypothetical protein